MLNIFIYSFLDIGSHLFMELFGPFLLILENFLARITIHIAVIAFEGWIIQTHSISLGNNRLWKWLLHLGFELFGRVVTLVHLTAPMDLSPALLGFLLDLNLLFDILGNLRILHQFFKLFDRNIFSLIHTWARHIFINGFLLNFIGYLGLDTRFLVVERLRRISWKTTCDLLVLLLSGYFVDEVDLTLLEDLVFYLVGQQIWISCGG